MRTHYASRVVLLIAALLCGFLSSSQARAEDSAALAARLQAAQQDSSLEDPSLKPWHLKLTVHLFDAKGRPSDDGTIEEWWSSPGHDRREYNTSAYKAIEVRDGDKQYRSKDSGTPPYLLALLRDQAVDPLSLQKEDTSHAELRKESFGKATLECIMLSQPIKRVAFPPLGLFPTYCFDVGKNDLRASFEFGNQMIIRNGVGMFQSKQVGTRVSVMSATTKLASGEVATLETFSRASSPTEPSTSGDLVEQNLSPVKVSSGTMAGKAVSQPQPYYPESSKANHTTGTVLLHAIIGTDGHVHSLRIVSTPDPDLAISAVSAVRQWTYTPYLLMGVPVDVETTITVNYMMSQ